MDLHLVHLVSRRRDLVRELMQRKRQHGLSLVDREQEQRVYRRAARWSKELGIRPEVMLRCFALILTECKRQAVRPVRRNARNVRRGRRD